MEKIIPCYRPGEDAFIWAIASPEKLRSCIQDDTMPIECFLIWNIVGFWENRDYPFMHQEAFDRAKNLLCDEYSKKVFQGYINAKKGNVDEDIFYSTDGTYFNEVTRIKREGAFVDCGSYDGTTAIDYLRFINEDRKVYAFEPDKSNYQNLADKMKDRPNFICLNKGCYSSEKTLSFSSNSDMSSSLQEKGDTTVEVTTIDKAVGDEKVAFIKMDIEGAELEALKGGRKVIERDMPILAISAYHRQEDLIVLLPYINNLHNKNEKYDLYLRHHGVVETELVIYGIPKAYDPGKLRTDQ